MTKDEFTKVLLDWSIKGWHPQPPNQALPPDGTLALTPRHLADILELMGLLTAEPVQLTPLSYDPACPVCKAQPHRECEGRTLDNPHPQRRELAWQLQFSDLEDRIELLERRAAEDDEDG